MAVLVRCPNAACNRLTGWTYPNFQWAKTHVPGVPPRAFIYDSRENMRGMSLQMCPDPFGHVNAFLAFRGLPAIEPEARFAPPDEDPIDDPNEGDLSSDGSDVWARIMTDDFQAF